METNLARLAEAALERSGDYPSLHYGGEWFSSVDLHERATRVASGLRAAGAHGPSADMGQGRIAKQESNEIQA